MCKPINQKFPINIPPKINDGKTLNKATENLIKPILKQVQKFIVYISTKHEELNVVT